MAKTKPKKTLADYVAIAISPALIMALVGSLVFFLVAVLYRGEHVGRLDWILFFFVFGAVLIARISMTGEIADRAGVYGFILGLLVWLGLLTYVDWKNSGGLARFGWLIDLGLIAVTWWCAHRLTWDCTLIDDAVDASGAGLLQVAGLEKSSGQDGPPAPEPEDGKKEAPDEPGLLGWWERYRRYREEQRRRPHAPGVWVVYFSLAALPLFGLGQAILAADSTLSGEALQAAQNYTFWLMTVYVGSGLGLLLTTSFLGLRRYLRQRNLRMPVTMTGVWLTMGAVLIAALLLVGALLPRPDGRSKFLEGLLGNVDSPERKASDWDQLGDSPGKDRGRGAREQKQGKDKSEQGQGRDRSTKDQKPDKNGRQEGGQKNQRDRGDRDRSTRDGKPDKDSRASGNQKDGKEQGGRDRSEKKQPKDGIGDRGRKEGGNKKDEGGKKKEDNKAEASSQGGGPPEPPPVSRNLANILKWIVVGIIGLVILFFLLRSGLKFLANFTHWARRLLEILRSFWEGLWSWWGGKSGAEEEEAEAEEAEEPRPFASFSDPFLSGAAGRMAPERLVRYSFEAFQAWALERGLGRQTGETPLEFAERVGEDIPALELPARRLAAYYAQVAYARGTLTGACREPLRQFWRLLVEVVERPMSAGVGEE